MGNYPTKSIRKSTICMLLLFLFAVDIFDLSGILIAGTICIAFLLYGEQFSFDKNVFLLLLFSVSYFICISMFEPISIQGIIKYFIAPWGSYLIGYSVLKVDYRMTVNKFAFIVLAGFFIHGMLNFYSSVKIYGFNLSSNYRLAYDFWQDRDVSVTTAALYYSPMAVYALCSLLHKGGNKLLALVTLIPCLIVTMLYQNRTLIVVLGFLVFVRLIRYMLDAAVSTTKKILVMVGLLVVLMGVVVSWAFDVGGMRSFLSGTRLFERFTGEDQSRTDAWISFILDAWKYPFGIGDAPYYGDHFYYAHNLWLDVYRRAGVIPFVALVCFTVEAIRTGRKFLGMTGIRDKRQIIVFTLLGIACISGVEPIIEANPYFFYLAIMIIGAMNGRIARREAALLWR